MSLPIVFRRAARAEFDEAFDWYEDDRPGRGAAFAARVQQVLDQISEQPESHAIVERDVRRAIVPKCPYSIIYRVEADRVVILAVFHGRRDPGIWRSRT